MKTTDITNAISDAAMMLWLTGLVHANLVAYLGTEIERSPH